MLHLKVYMHILEEDGERCAQQIYFDTSAEEGGVKVWEPNARGNQSRTQTNFCLGINTLGINPQHTTSVSSSTSPRRLAP